MTVEEALRFFSDHKAISNKLQPLFDVGLGYVKLGQSSNSLSGGEAQRVKLASFLGKGSSVAKKDHTLFMIYTNCYCSDTTKVFLPVRIMDLEHVFNTN